MDDQDDGAKVGLWVVLGIITLLLFGLIGGLAIRATNAKHAINLIPFIEVLLAVLIFLMLSTTYSRFTELRINLPAADAEKLRERPGEVVVSVSSDGRYAVNRQAVDGRSVELLSAELAAAVKALADAPSRKLVIAGFHDPSGDPAHNADLAKRRAMAVRAALTGQGADAARVQLRKPEQTALGGPPEEARRVEVRLVD